MNPNRVARRPLVAAPIFARVAQHSLRLLGVMPDKDGEGGDEPQLADNLLAKRGQ